MSNEKINADKLREMLDKALESKSPCAVLINSETNCFVGAKGSMLDQAEMAMYLLTSMGQHEYANAPAEIQARVDELINETDQTRMFGLGLVTAFTLLLSHSHISKTDLDTFIAGLQTLEKMAGGIRERLSSLLNHKQEQDGDHV